MTNLQIFYSFRRDFSEAELVALGTKPVAPITEMARGDKIIVEDALLDYFQKFFNNNFDGEPIPKTFESALIESQSKSGFMRIYVSHPENKPNWVYLDLFESWTYLGKVIMANGSYDDSERTEDGRFKLFYYWIPKITGLPDQFYKELCAWAVDVYMYSFLYVEANKDVNALYREENKTSLKPTGIPKKNVKKNKGPKKEKPVERDKVYVPKRRIYTLKKTEENERRLAEYVYSRWKVRGYSYTRKDGRVVNVKEHWAYRHFPNKGIEKEGTDFILRPADSNN